MDDKVSCNGIYGMPGVGRTAVVKEDKFLKHVYWFSDANSAVSKLQDDLAGDLHVDISNMDVGDDRKRAAKLSRALDRKNKFVIVLDGVSTPIDVGKIGIPLGKEGRKLIVELHIRDQELPPDVLEIARSCSQGQKWAKHKMLQTVQ
ncbi:probable disease resistance protein At1g61300 [Coffea arabica]|uniref:Probable disease resistance protein At1g61300 n=1 Tax=Coffea arabica TaxID=13443 RepID=A0ABM4V363_COFAR